MEGQSGHLRRGASRAWRRTRTELGKAARSRRHAFTLLGLGVIGLGSCGVGAALGCFDEALSYAKERIVFDRPIGANQAIQFPLAELHTEAAMLRALIRQTAWEMDRVDHGMEISDKVAMCNYRANRLCCDAADRAMQTCGGVGYSRHMPFEHIYRHHRRYRITEGAEEIQMRKVAQHLFGFGRS